MYQGGRDCLFVTEGRGKRPGGKGDSSGCIPLREAAKTQV